MHEAEANWALKCAHSFSKQVMACYHASAYEPAQNSANDHECRVAHEVEVGQVPKCSLSFSEQAAVACDHANAHEHAQNSASDQECWDQHVSGCDLHLMAAWVEEDSRSGYICPSQRKLNLTYARKRAIYIFTILD